MFRPGQFGGIPGRPPVMGAPRPQVMGAPRPQVMGAPPLFGSVRPLFIPGKSIGKGTTAFEDEDRSRDWYCPNCKERNFVKRAECFKCRNPKPKDSDLSAAAIRPQPPPSGTTLNGMVKSFNRNGFGFLMVMGADYGQDIYYTRENLSRRLQTRNIPGQHVTFELHRFPDGKLTALNIRPVGEAKEEPPVFACKGKGFGFGLGFSLGKGVRSVGFPAPGFVCGKGLSELGPVGAAASAGSALPSGLPPRSLSPHAGSRAVREALAGRIGAGGSRSRSRSRSRRKTSTKGKKRKGSSGSSSASDESSNSSGSSGKEKKKKKKKKKSRSSSSSSRRTEKSAGSSSKSSDCKMEEPSGSGSRQQGSGGGDPEVEAAKGEALERLMKLRSVEPKEARMSEWRALLRKWHPDKNPDRVEVATAVFQFLQKGKAILDEK